MVCFYGNAAREVCVPSLAVASDEDSVADEAVEVVQRACLGAAGECCAVTGSRSRGPSRRNGCPGTQGRVAAPHRSGIDRDHAPRLNLAYVIALRAAPVVLWLAVAFLLLHGALAEHPPEVAITMLVLGMVMAASAPVRPT